MSHNNFTTSDVNLYQLHVNLCRERVSTSHNFTTTSQGDL